MDTHNLLPCPFCGGIDLAFCSAPGEPSRFRIKCNTCHAQIVDDRKDKVQGWWNQRNILKISGQIIYLQPNIEENPLYPKSDVQGLFESLAKKLAAFQAPDNKDAAAWEKAQEEMQIILLDAKQLDKAIRDGARERKRAARKKQKNNQS